MAEQIETAYEQEAAETAAEKREQSTSPEEESGFSASGEEEPGAEEEDEEDGENSEEALWEDLEERIGECTKCPLWKTRTNVVVGSGDRKAALMFVGEAPGENEDLQGIPFVGKAGQLFNDYLEAVGIDRDSVYVCNILKCRPPKNRDPLPDEENCCIGFLREQVRLVKPKIIVCLGRISAMRLIRPDFKITKEHGVFIQRGRFLMCAVYHPALLLRDPSRRTEMYCDMKEIKRRLDQLG